MMREILACVLILLIILMSCSCLNKPHWGVKPYIEYHKLVEKFGEPSFINTSPYGSAVWKKFGKCSPFARIMIVDEKVIHTKPHNHCDFIYVTIKYHIDPKKMRDVLSISDSIMYDKLKQEVTVRCNTLETAVATIVMVDGVHNDIITNSQVSGGLMYGDYMSNARKDVVNNYRVLQSIKDDYELKYGSF